MRNAAIDYLRTTLTFMVVAHHSALAYTTFARSGGNDYRAGTAPVVDENRWIVLDHAQNFNDVFFMSAFFFISGLFFWPSLNKVGVLKFLQAKLLRLGIPFAVGTAVIMPIAYYPSWRLSGGSAGYFQYWLQNISQDGFTPGPLWFIWMLLAFNMISIAFWPILKQTIGWVSRLFAVIQDRPVSNLLIILTLLSAAYFPLLHAFGPDTWGALPIPPFYGQLSRVLLYFTWFLLGITVGFAGIERTVFKRDGPLTRYGLSLFLGAIGFYLIMNFLPRILFAAEVASYPQARLLYDVLWVPSCLLTTVGFFAIFQRYAVRTHASMDWLSHNAYGAYIVHYVFVLWFQWALMPLELFAGVKFAIVATGAVMTSWIIVDSLRRLPAIRRIV